jgi:hypothetical protein
MSNFATTLTDAASAVSALGTSQAEIESLDDASLQAGMRMLRELDQQVQPYKLWLAAAIARRSDHTLGYQGLARKNGFPTPATFIQSLTGTSMDEAAKLARLGAMVVEAESAPQVTVDGVGGSGGTAIATAATSGGICLDAAEAIRKGLGASDAAVTDEQLRVAAEKLIAHAARASILGVVTPEALLKLARQARNELDLAAIERGEKEGAAARYVRIWERDGFYGGSWRLAGEDGGIEVNTALKLLLAKTNGGPRFPQTNADGEPIAETAVETELEDTRSADHILADGFTEIFHNGLAANPSIVPGARRAAVRVIVEEKVLTAASNRSTNRDSSSSSSERSGSALLEDNLSSITFAKLEEYLCEGGTVGVIFNDDGTIDVGREQRLFTARQRTALGVRDGGCRFPGCNKPPSWTEAHHIAYWDRDRGKTDIVNGMPWFAKRTYVVETEGVDDGKDEEAWRGWQFAGGVVCADQF